MRLCCLKRPVFYLLLLAALPSQAQDQEPGTTDFAYGISIAPQQSKAAYRLLIPQSIYETVVSKRLNDVRVFNSDGEVLPHEISHSAGKQSLQKVPVPFVALQSSKENLEKLKLFYQQDEGKVNFKVSPEVVSSAANSTTYILKVAGLEGNREQIELDWTFEKPGSYFFTANVEASHDLENWSFKQKPAALAQLELPGETVLNNTIPIRHCGCPYYRLVLSGRDRPALTEIRLIIRQVESNQKKKRLAVAVQKEADTRRSFIADADNYTDKVAVRIPLLQNNTIARVSVSSADSTDGPWHQRGAASLYRVKNANGVQARDMVDIESTNDRYLKVIIENEGSGLESSLTEIEYDWIPHNLTFLARGAAPFQLAFGSAEYVRGEADYAAVFSQLYQQSKPHVFSGDHALSARKTLGGPSKLYAAAEPVNKKHWLLWLILSMASAFLLWMAWSTWQNAGSGDGT